MNQISKSQLEQVQRRRTFAIISHPDAGKTTLTEKLLLYGGAIKMAGRVKARGELRRARSDWMKVEQERGISVSASVMTFEHADRRFNLLDTPGHEDFSEDTYRTLTAVDSAVMVLDAAKGIEPQTRKLFEVCRLRDMPTATFINKLDRESLDPFALLDEIEQTLQIEVAPVTWPVGRAPNFLGCYDLLQDRLLLLDRRHREVNQQAEEARGLDDPRLAQALPEKVLAELREEVDMVRELCVPFSAEAYLAGNLTPTYFGSALHSFGVQDLLDGLARHAPAPRPQPTEERLVDPSEPKVTAFVFKIQANMDPRHRDRIAFVRISSGRFQRGMKLRNTRSDRTSAVHDPLLFMARDRERVEEAWPGDIIGIQNRGNLHIGDTLTEGEELHVVGIPRFAPELLRRVRPDDPMRAKHLGRALLQLAEEGAAQVFRKRIGGDWIVGVAGALQFDVLADRIRSEYDVEAHYDSTQFTVARWLRCEDERELKRFINDNEIRIAEDHKQDPVFLAASSYYVDRAQETWPKIEMLRTREQRSTAPA